MHLISVNVEGYIISYNNFDDYKLAFVNSSNDMKKLGLVGIRNSEIQAQLFKQNTVQNVRGYSAFIPVKVKNVRKK
jgi:hypothetical protein